MRRYGWVKALAVAAIALWVLASANVAMGAGNVAVVSNVKVLSDKCEDVSSPEAWKATYIKPGMSDQDKAIAIWKTVTKYRHQDNPPNEGIEQGGEKGNVHEPFKTINVYGYGMCCCAAADIEGLARYIGLPARGRIINLHSVPEVWYDNSWHLLDSSLMFYLIKPDGKIAGVDEMKKNIADWKKDHPEIKNDGDWKNFGKDEGWKKGPSLFATCQFYDKDGINRAGWHGWWSNMSEYNYKVVGTGRKFVVPPDTQGTFNVYDYGATMGYQVNVELREGEKLTRRWFATDAATGINRNNAKRYDKFLEGDMTSLGLQKDLGDLSPGRIGNGTLVYDALADSNLPADALKFENLKLEGGKLRVADPAKSATLIVRMNCSYVYLNGEMTTSAALGAGGSIAASISFNNGLDWQDLAKLDKAGEQKTDLKALVFNKYDYRVKFDFKGAGTGLDALKFTDDFQHSQAPLPLLTEGDNKVTFSAARVAEGTVTVMGWMDPEDAPATPAPAGKPGKAVGKSLTILDFHPTATGAAEVKRFAIGTTRKHDEDAAEISDLQKPFANPPNQGTVIVPVTTPGDMTRIRMGVHWRARNPADGFVVSASFDKGRTWKEMFKLDMAHPAKSGYFIFNEVPAGARDAQVKFDGTQTTGTEIFDLRIDADYKEPAGGFRPVKVTYEWEENVPPPPAPVKGKKANEPVVKPHGTVKTNEHVCMTPEDAWTIHCPAGMVLKSYTVELAK